MIDLKWNVPEGRGLKILCLGAHCDDIEIGCGGTLLKIMESYEIEQLKWVVFASNEKRKAEAEAGAAAFLENLPQSSVDVFSFRDAFLPYSAVEVKEKFEAIKKEIEPDVVFTHYRHDRHQDHRLLSDLAWNTFRNHMILEYEIPKYDGDMGIPNCFVPITQEQAEKKIQIILDAYASQKVKHWLDRETLISLMRLRGMESVTRYAEAFHLRKVIL
ncbi:MAG: PIG-L deacetylase family protein [Bacteroidota bacterium]